jgi:ribosome biogenesis protein Nip4
VCRLLVGKPEGKRPLRRPRRRWIDNIKMDLFEIGVNVVDWIGLAQNRYRWRALVNSVMNVRFEVFTAVTMKNGVFWVVTPCGSCKNRRFGRTYHLFHQCD